MGVEGRREAHEELRLRRHTDRHRHEMGNGQSGCFPKKAKDKEEDVVFADEAETEQPPAAAEDEPMEENEENTEEEAPDTQGATSPAPPLISVQLKQVDRDGKRSRCGWYEFGIDEKVCAILRAVEMEHYIPNFAFHHVEFETLPYLTLEDLKDMNVNRVGHRRKLLGKFREIKS